MPDKSDGERSAASMERARTEVRREGWKAAIVYATVDAVALGLAVNLAVAALGVAELPAQVGLPAIGPLGGVTPPVAALLGAAVALVGFVVEVWLRVRRPLIEQFEAANPPVAEALRTARDAVAADTDSRMVERLYGDVLERLGESSGVALVDIRRVAGTVVVVVLLSLATLQVAVTGVALLAGGPADAASDAVDRSERPDVRLQNGSAVLGDSEDVSAGEENLTAQVDSTGGDRTVERDEPFPAGGAGDAATGDTEGQQAGFADPEQVEDAALVREYSLRIRDDEDDT